MNKDILNALIELEREKGIKQDVVLEAIRSALETGYKKNYGKATNFSIEIDKTNGEYKLFQDKTVVVNVENNNLEISLEEAKTIDLKFELGDIVKLQIEPKQQDK
jgi:N utilization substance protein A